MRGRANRGLAAPALLATRSQGDRAKAIVMKHIGRLVADGVAELDRLDDGDIQLRFNTGAMFLLTETVIVRIA